MSRVPEFEGDILAANTKHFLFIGIVLDKLCVEMGVVGAGKDRAPSPI